jgi:hypothetical protein
VSLYRANQPGVTGAEAQPSLNANVVRGIFHYLNVLTQFASARSTVNSGSRNGVANRNHSDAIRAAWLQEGSTPKR